MNSLLNAAAELQRAETLTAKRREKLHAEIFAAIDAGASVVTVARIISWNRASVYELLQRNGRATHPTRHRPSHNFGKTAA